MPRDLIIRSDGYDYSHSVNFGLMALLNFVWVAGLGVLEKGSLGCGLSKPIMGFQSPSWAFKTHRGLFFLRKMAPIFLQAPNLWVRCRRRFFFLKNDAHISGSP